MISVVIIVHISKLPSTLCNLHITIDARVDFLGRVYTNCNYMWCVSSAPYEQVLIMIWQDQCQLNLRFCFPFRKATIKNFMT